MYLTAGVWSSLTARPAAFPSPFYLMKRIILTASWLAVAVLAVKPLKAEGYRPTLGTATDNSPVIVVSGTPYEMGLALGTLAKPEIQAFAPLFLQGAQAAKKDACSSANLDEAWQIGR